MPTVPHACLALPMALGTPSRPPNCLRTCQAPSVGVGRGEVVVVVVVVVMVVVVVVVVQWWWWWWFSGGSVVDRFWWW